MKNEKRHNEIPKQMVPFDNRGIGYVIPSQNTDLTIDTKHGASKPTTIKSISKTPDTLTSKAMITPKAKKPDNTATNNSAKKDETENETQTSTEKDLKPEPKYQYDLKKNWAIARLLIEQQVIPVQWIFVSNGLKKLLIEYAERKKEPSEILEIASDILHQPSNSAAHDNHFHVRVYCSKSDQRNGCIDAEPSVFAPDSWFDTTYATPVESKALKTFLAAANCSR